MGKGHSASLQLVDALYIPGASICLISVGRLNASGLTITIANGCLTVRTSVKAPNVFAVAIRLPNHLYRIVCEPIARRPPRHPDTSLKSNPHSPIPITPIVASLTAPVDLRTIHNHLGHASMQTIIDMARNGVVTGMPLNLASMPPHCEHCILGKQAKLLVPKTHEGAKAERLLEKVYADIIGPIAVEGLQKEVYSLDISDDCSSMSFVYPIHNKDDACGI